MTMAVRRPGLILMRMPRIGTVLVGFMLMLMPGRFRIVMPVRRIGFIFMRMPGVRPMMGSFMFVSMACRFYLIMEVTRVALVVMGMLWIRSVFMMMTRRFFIYRFMRYRRAP